jgi:hypothetical protein
MLSFGGPIHIIDRPGFISGTTRFVVALQKRQKVEVIHAADIRSII